MDRNYRCDYNNSAIGHIIDANTKLIDEVNDLKRKLEIKEKYINNIKWYLKYKVIENVEQVSIDEIFNYLDKLDNSESSYEKDIFDFI